MGKWAVSLSIYKNGPIWNSKKVEKIYLQYKKSMNVNAGAAIETGEIRVLRKRLIQNVFLERWLLQMENTSER